MSTAPMPKRGEIWLIDFDPPVGAEMAKIRPAVIINEDHIGRLPLHRLTRLTDFQLVSESKTVKKCSSHVPFDHRFSIRWPS